MDLIKKRICISLTMQNEQILLPIVQKSENSAISCLISRKHYNKLNGHQYNCSSIRMQTLYTKGTLNVLIFDN